MQKDDLERFAADLRDRLGLTTEVVASARADGIHVLRINDVEFFFNADGSGYDGWGRSLAGDRQTAKGNGE